MPKVKKVSGGFQYQTRGGKNVGSVQKTEKAARAQSTKGKK